MTVWKKAWSRILQNRESDGNSNLYNLKPTRTNTGCLTMWVPVKMIPLLVLSRSNAGDACPWPFVYVVSHCLSMFSSVFSYATCKGYGVVLSALFCCWERFCFMVFLFVKHASIVGRAASHVCENGRDSPDFGMPLVDFWLTVLQCEMSVAVGLVDVAWALVRYGFVYGELPLILCCTII